MPPRALVSTVPFGSLDPLPLKLLDDSGIDYLINPLGRRLTEQELIEMAPDIDILIAGTEPITREVLFASTRLCLIARVGIGLDNVDLVAARERGVNVTYTPDAPAPAVAELAIANILALLRSTHVANLQLRRGQWNRTFGRRIPDVTIGVIGVGRIGSRVLRRLGAFGSPRVLLNDLSRENATFPGLKPEWVSKQDIYRSADVITLHVPLTSETRGMIARDELLMMKPDALLVNTARGGLVDEEALYEVMKRGHLGGVALDVFEHEPYVGPLGEFERCLLTCHMGSMSEDCRARMEVEAVQEALRFVQGLPLFNPVPDYEYAR